MRMREQWRRDSGAEDTRSRVRVKATDAYDFVGYHRKTRNDVLFVVLIVVTDRSE